MGELNIEYVDEPVDEPVDESVDESADNEDEPVVDSTDPIAPEVKPPVSFNEDQQRVFDDAISKKVAKQREAERELAQLQQELAQARQRLPQETRPELPPIPDAWADDFQEQMTQRDQILLQQSEFDTRKRWEGEQQQRAEMERQLKEQDDMNKVVESYADRAKKQGIKPAELQAAANVVASYNLDNSLIAHILTEKHGPSITHYLAKNPVVMDSLRAMTPMQAAVKISGEISEAAKSVQGGKQPPAPTETLRGGGAPERGRGPKEATYE